jgi:hypothetical protein
MSVNLSPLGGAGAQFFSNNGVPLAGGLLYTYSAGTSTPATAYTSSPGNTALANPIILDAAGRVPTGEIWLTDGVSYKFVLKDATNALIATWDNLTGINSNFIPYAQQKQTFTATQGQTVITLTTIEYVVGVNNIAVYVNGSKQIVGVNYTETSSTVITFVSGLNVGDVVECTTSVSTTTNPIDSGSTANRPSSSAITGQYYFDTTIGKPIWWNGTIWVLATGLAA